MFLALFAS